MPPFPEGASYLWTVYFRLRRRKGGTGFGAAPLEWPDLDAFCRMTGFRFAAWELNIIERLDDAYMKSAIDKTEAEE